MWILYSTRCVLLVLAALLVTHVAEATEKRPNIIYILADNGPILRWLTFGTRCMSVANEAEQARV